MNKVRILSVNDVSKDKEKLNRLINELDFSKVISIGMEDVFKYNIGYVREDKQCFVLVVEMYMDKDEMEKHIEEEFFDFHGIRSYIGDHN